MRRAMLIIFKTPSHTTEPAQIKHKRKANLNKYNQKHTNQTIQIISKESNTTMHPLQCCPAVHHDLLN